MHGSDKRDLGIAALGREISSDAARIRRRALGKKAARVGGRSVAALALALAVLVAVPPFTWPIRGRVSSGFFFRLAPDSRQILDIEFHRGLDIAAPTGTPVYATAPGIVVEAGRSPDLGNFVRVRHLLGLESVYGHLSRIDAARRRLILLPGLQGLGAVGSTGRSTGPHLHFAIKAGSIFVPPRSFLVFHSIRRAIIGF